MPFIYRAGEGVPILYQTGVKELLSDFGANFTSKLAFCEN